MSVPIPYRRRFAPTSRAPAGLPRAVRAEDLRLHPRSRSLHARIAWAWVGRPWNGVLLGPRDLITSIGGGARTLQRLAHSGVTTTARTQTARILVSALLVAAAGPALAFHSGGVADCEGCHSMHNSTGGATAVGGRARVVPARRRGLELGLPPLPRGGRAPGAPGPFRVHLDARPHRGQGAEAAHPRRRLRLAEEDLHVDPGAGRRPAHQPRGAARPQRGGHPSTATSPTAPTPRPRAAPTPAPTSPA